MKYDRWDTRVKGRTIATATRHQTNQVYLLLLVEGTRHIFIVTDTSMKDSVTFEIVSRRKETAVIPRMTITFTTTDDPQILLDVKLTRVNWHNVALKLQKKNKATSRL